MSGSKHRAKLIRVRYDEVVALHHHARRIEPHPVIVVYDGEAPAPVVEPAAGSDDGTTALLWLPFDRAAAWLDGYADLSRLATPAPDAMDVVVLAGGGASVMRLTAR